ETYNDNRVLLHIPRGFDVRRPGLLVVFFHGHGANLENDVFARQQVPQQLTASGVNAVLIAPQLAVNAADSSIGKLWQRGGFARLLDEAAVNLAAIYGDRRAAKSFASMPVVIVAYSGGYVAAAWSVYHGGIGSRLRGVVLLDGLYGELDKFTNWIASDESVFFISAYTDSTRRANEHLKQVLTNRDYGFATALEPRLRPGTLAFIEPEHKASHRDFVTNAWAHGPLTDLFSRFVGYRRK